MEIIGLIAEYSPFHNGHIYQLQKIKELYPDSLIIVVLNGYFLQRGIPSIISKEEKIKKALEYGVDIVIEHPFIFSSNSADIFASSAIELLNYMHINRLIFGSESNDIDLLTSIAQKQIDQDLNSKIKDYLDSGLNYPTALNKALDININEPNDLLGISYIKAIIKNNYSIKVETIKRTNDYHDTTSNSSIISASNIRQKIKNNQDISKYMPSTKINIIDEDLLFKLLKYKIITEDNLNKYLTVDEGIENRIKKIILKANNIDELVKLIKSKRYTYNRMMRMLMHILIGVTKENKNKIVKNDYIRLLGFSEKGQEYLNQIKKDIEIPIITKLSSINSKIKDYELKSAQIYEIITNENILDFEYNNKPIYKNEKK